MYEPSNQGPPASNTRSRAPSPSSSHSSPSTSEDEEEHDLTDIETHQEDPVLPAEQNFDFNLPDVYLETSPDDIMAEASLAPQPFTREGEDPTVWWTSVEQYVTFRKLTDEQFMGLFPLLLGGTAAQWFQNLKETEKRDNATLKTTFSTAFQQRKCCPVGQRAPVLWQVPRRALCDAVHHKHADCCTRTGSPGRTDH